MQSINVTVLSVWFLGAFLGTAAACGLAVVGGFVMLDEPAGFYLLTGGALYLIGTFLVTVAANVPLNKTLAAVEPAGPGSAERWSHYRARWTAWNHVRTVAALLAAVLLSLALE